MALVMLPCDLPWWTTVTKRLTAIEEAKDIDEIVDNMLKIHDLCNVSLDPDEDNKDKTIFEGFQLFVETILESQERDHFLNFTIKTLAKHAKTLKQYRPARGLSFSLQQQKDTLDLDLNFVAALLANAFFSTFPKRTTKTHPTLQDFNFTHFFNSLDLNAQIAKLKSFFQYFEWLEKEDALTGSVRISRKVMTGKQWLTIEDWLECSLPLCPLEIKHEGRLDQSDGHLYQTVFTSSRLGGSVLYHGSSQECIYFSTFPEMLAILLYVEALEDNEALTIENLHQVSHIRDVKDKAVFEKLDVPKKTSLCCIDAENYSSCPPTQFEEDNVLRELNKCLLAYRQNALCPIVEARERKGTKEDRRNRLSPIGENNLSGDMVATIVVKQASTATIKSSCDSQRMERDINKRRSWLVPPDINVTTGNQNEGLVTGPLASGRRGRFIVLGSSGECLPVTRSALSQCGSNSLYSSCNSSIDEEFHSATASGEESEDEGFSKRYSKELDTPERRNTFAQKLKDALKSESGYTDSTDDSYACGIHIAGSQTDDQEIKVRRGGSRGFILTEDSLDEEFYRDLLVYEDQARTNNRPNRKSNNGPNIKRHDTQDSSKYSFSTEFSSELEEVFDQISKWLDDPIDDKNRVLDPRDEAVLQFANSLLKRTLSETFVGVPLSDDGFYSLSSGSRTGISAADFIEKQERDGKDSCASKRNRFIINARSLSLELAKHNHRLAAQLLSQLTKKHAQIDNKNNLQPVATGNWGCGSNNKGDVQLKLVIQWMAASVAGLPALIYYTAGNENLTKLDTVRRILLDRKMVVGKLALTTLRHAREILDDPGSYVVKSDMKLFDKLIGIESA